HTPGLGRRRPVRVVAGEAGHGTLLEALALTEGLHLVCRRVVLAVLCPDGAVTRLERLPRPVRKRPLEHPGVAGTLATHVDPPLAAQGARVEDGVGLLVLGVRAVILHVLPTRAVAPLAGDPQEQVVPAVPDGRPQDVPDPGVVALQAGRVGVEDA